MSEYCWLNEPRLRRMKPYFPRPRGWPRVADRRVTSGIIHAMRNGLRWRDAPEVHGPHTTLCNRFVRWSRKGVFDRIFGGLAESGEAPDIAHNIIGIVNCSVCDRIRTSDAASTRTSAVMQLPQSAGVHARLSNAGT